MKDLQNAARHSIQVQLESCKNLDVAIIERVKELKAKRKFTTTFRDMASLYFSLQDGDTSVLIALFPWIVDVIEAKQPGSHYQASVTETQPLMVGGNLKSLTGSSNPLPGPEDHDDLADLLEVKDAMPEGGSVAAQNLINSMLALQSAKSDKPAKPSKVVKRERQSLEDMLEIKVADGE